MKTRSLHTIFSLALVMLISFSLQAQERKVLFIGIDGVRSDALMDANTPVMDEFFAQGWFTYTSYHLGITVSGPSWSSMLTGVWEPKHGVTNNSYTGSNFNDYPYLVTRVREYRPDLKAVQITSWGPFSFDVYNVDWDADVLVGSDDACRDAALLQLLDPELDFMFLHFDDADATGHGQGFNPLVPSYINIIEYIDGQIGEVLEALEARPTYDQEDWLVLFTTDHGGIGFGHGGNSLQEKEIWWAAVGSTAPVGEVSINITDPNQWLNSPVLTDIAVSAIDHLLPDEDIESLIEEWDLDGKSWLIDPTTSVEELTTVKDLYTFSPNPATDNIQIELNSKGQEAELRLVDITGKTVLMMNIPHGETSFPVITSTYPRGTYFMEIISDRQRQTEKIILK